MRQENLAYGDLVVHIADDLQLTQAERDLMIPSGGVTVITSRVNWAKSYLKHAGLLEQPKRAHVQITARGRTILAANPLEIDNQVL